MEHKIFIVGTASNLIVEEAVRFFFEQKKKRHRIFLLLKKGRILNIQESVISDIVYFEDDFLSKKNLKVYQDMLINNKVVVVHNTNISDSYLNIYRALFSYTNNIDAFFPDGSVRRIDRFHYIKQNLSVLCDLLFFSLFNLFIRILSVFPLSSLTKRRWLAGIGLIFWFFFRKDRDKQRLLFSQLGKYRHRCCAEKKRAEVKNVLLFSFVGIGNSVMRTPLAEGLKRKNASLKLFLIVEEKTGEAEIWKYNPHVDKVWEVPVKNYKWFSFIKFIGYTGKCDHAIIPFCSQHPLAYLLACFCGCKSIIVHDSDKTPAAEYCATEKFFFNSKEHEVCNNLNLLKSSREITHGLSPLLVLPGSVLSWRDKFLKEEKLKESLCIGIHAGGTPSAFIKRWNALHFVFLADKLQENYQCEIFLFGTAMEKDFINVILKNTKKQCRDFSKKLSLLETMALISVCDLFISNDSGLMHIANAFSIPQVALFGPSSSLKNGPYCLDNAIVIKSKKECSPCYKLPSGYNQECQEKDCMDFINKEEVLHAAESLLSKIFLKVKCNAGRRCL